MPEETLIDKILNPVWRILFYLYAVLAWKSNAKILGILKDKRLAVGQNLGYYLDMKKIKIAKDKYNIEL